MKNCRFCQIINKKLETIMWEDEEFFAVLDVNPNTEGMTLVVTKKHYPSYIFDMNDELYQKFMIAAKKVAKLLDQKLSVQRTAMVMEGTGINHAHIKLYPLHGLSKKFEERWPKKKVFFREYENYVTTQLGPRADVKELKKLAEKIKKPKRLKKGK